MVNEGKIAVWTIQQVVMSHIIFCPHTFATILGIRASASGGGGRKR
jgi:hypothetical protein